MSEVGALTRDLLWQAAEGMVSHMSECSNRSNRISGKIFPSTKEVVMEVIISHPQGVMLKDVAKKVNRTPGAVSQIIESLVREGMVERSVSKYDRRVIMLNSTSTGAQARTALLGRIDGLMTDIMQTVPAKDQIVFFKTLKHIVQMLVDDTSMKRAHDCQSRDKFRSASK